RNRAAVVAANYLMLEQEGQHRFFTILAEDFGVDRPTVDSLIKELRDSEDRGAVERKLRTALEAERELLFRRFLSVESGLAFVVGLRADLLAFNDPALADLDDELRRLLDRWFDAGLLTLSQINWDSPASLLEKLVEYEAVHAVTSWGDLKNRLRSDRRLFAFQHPGLPNDLLIFVEVALVSGLANSVDDLLNTSAPIIDSDQTDTAIFYSISNCQDGLAGVRLGDFLIKKVVTELSREQPSLKTFATLSPIPGFRRWLEEKLEQPNFFDLEEETKSALHTALKNPKWGAETQVVSQLREALPKLGAHYLLLAKRGSRASDPVANFHLSNGARIERIVFGANQQDVAQDRALGMMVNYRYEISKIEDRHDAYVHDGIIDAHNDILALLPQSSEART
ncbi:MAG TPA: malonyl-CoA decarboxylase, partial [Acidimicrobiaceae bacterium]|nr:malonyl-CoA decarboxylase [Acidimicrobiaceae bacterium]